MIVSILGPQRQQSGFGAVSQTKVGTLPLSGLTPDDDAYDSVPAGAPGYVPAGTCVLALFVGGDPQALSGIGPVGWVAPP